MLCVTELFDASFVLLATFNRKLNKLMKSYKHVKVLKTGLDRNLFTRQGMHMNNLGKERIALEIANEATKILSKQAKVISLQWKNNSTSDDYLEEISPPQVPPLQHLLRSDVNGDLGQLGQMTRAVKSH